MKKNLVIALLLGLLVGLILPRPQVQAGAEDGWTAQLVTRAVNALEEIARNTKKR